MIRRTATVDELRRELRTVTSRIRRAAADQDQRIARQTALMDELVSRGVAQAEVGRDVGLTRMAVGLRLAKFRERGSRSTV